MNIRIMAGNTDFVTEQLHCSPDHHGAAEHYTHTELGTVTVKRCSPMTTFEPAVITELLISGAASVATSVLSSWLYDLLRKAKSGNREVTFHLGNSGPFHVHYDGNGMTLSVGDAERKNLTPEVLEHELARHGNTSV